MNLLFHTFQVSSPSCTPWYAWTVQRPFGCWLHRKGANSEEQREMKKIVKRVPDVLRRPCTKLEREQRWNLINMACKCPWYILMVYLGFTILESLVSRTCHGDSENRTAKWKKCLVPTTVVSVASRPFKYLDVCNATTGGTPQQQTNLQGLGFGDGQMCQMHHTCHQQ